MDTNADAGLSLDREHEEQLTQVFQLFDTDKDGLLTLEEAEHAARRLGCHLIRASSSPERLNFPAFLQSLRRRIAETPEQALDVLASRFVNSVTVRPHSSMSAADLRRFFSESAENIPLSRLQDMIEAMDSSLEGEGATERDFVTFVNQTNEASRAIRLR